MVIDYLIITVGGKPHRLAAHPVAHHYANKQPENYQYRYRNIIRDKALLSVWLNTYMTLQDIYGWYSPILENYEGVAVTGVEK